MANKLKYLLMCHFFLSVGAIAEGDVTHYGSVAPDPIVAGGSYDDVDLQVGSTENDSDLRGYLLVDGGTELTFDRMFVGEHANYSGLVTIAGDLGSGAFGKIVIDETGSGAGVTIGQAGTGQVVVSNGGSLLISDNNPDFIIGQNAGSQGTLIVDGPFSYVELDDEFKIGAAGNGRVEILNSGLIYSKDPNKPVTIGESSGGVGVAVVSGHGSTWRGNGGLTIGDGGTGTLSISNSALVEMGKATTIGTDGRLELQGGTLDTISVSNGGHITGSGTVQGTVTNLTDGVINLSEDVWLRFDDLVTNNGSVVFDEGSGQFSTGLLNNGVLAILPGGNHLHGTITNGTQGTIVLSTNSVGTFYDSVDVSNGSLNLLAGSNALFLEDLDFSTGGSVALQLNSTSESSAQIYVAGEATLNGELEVDLAGSTPVLGDTYTLFSTEDGINGTFTSANLPSLAAGLSWQIDYTQDSVLIEVVVGVGVPGDFTSDGVVDGHDFLAWQRGESPDPLSQTDLVEWQNAYASAQSPLVSLVPEPATFVLTSLCALALSVRRSSAVRN